MTDGFGAIRLLFLAVPLIIIVVAVFAAGRGVARVTRSQKLKEFGRETTGTIVDNQMQKATACSPSDSPFDSEPGISVDC